ncbi:hypothetical protein [Streptomyces sp. NPDC002994]|uniref:hypothetical protein n=1 Tax=Streptomyces sp. NPDC002994 TaxID=3154441 RepID=UPI0033A6AE29
MPAWELTPAEEAALDDAYWGDRYADDDTDDWPEPPRSNCDCGTCCNVCGHEPNCTSNQAPVDE